MKSVLVFVVFILLGCEKRELVTTHYINPQCITTQSHCEINTSNGVFKVLFNVDPVITENEFDISLKLESALKIKNVSAYMEGKKMFMGKIPLFFQPTSEKNMYLTQAILGSCSDDKMRWVINFIVSIEQADKTLVDESFSIEFNSQRFN